MMKETRDTPNGAKKSGEMNDHEAANAREAGLGRDRGERDHGRWRRLSHRATPLLLSAGLIAGAVYLLLPPTAASALGFFGGGPACERGPGFFAGPHGHGGARKGPDEEDMRYHARSAAKRMLDLVDAGEGQREVVLGVVDRTVSDLADLRGAHEKLREEITAELTADSVDPEALERLRRRKLEQFDRVSRKITEALAEIAGVLNREQRLEIAEQVRGHLG